MFSINNQKFPRPEYDAAAELSKLVLPPPSGNPEQDKKNREKYLRRKHYILNRDKIIAQTKQWMLNNKKRWSANQKAARERIAADPIRRERQRLRKYKNCKAWFSNTENRDRVAAIKNLKIKKDRALNPEKYRIKERQWHEKYKSENPNYLIRKRLRGRVRKGITSRLNSSSKKRALIPSRSSEVTGCTIDFLISYLESKFVSGMSWKNMELWHIDHIKPCAKFDLTDLVQRNQCFHYSNLQPLWCSDNLKKWTHYVSN